jgi:drug/metabolite transporter (DMT)-like permease
MQNTILRKLNAKIKNKLRQVLSGIGRDHGGFPCFSPTALYTKWLSQREKLNHYQTLFPMMLFAISVLAGATLIFEWGHPMRADFIDLVGFGYQSIGAQFLAYILWFWLISRYPVSQVASFTFLVPLVGS